MSRYTNFISSGRQIAWGYDKPLQEYYLQEFYTEQEIDQHYERTGHELECVFSISNRHSTAPHPDYPHKTVFSNSEIAQLMRAYNTDHGRELIPEDHIQRTLLDHPF
jgi:hypothetical protein